jgi:preprotein translocase subunit SecA
MFKEMLAQIDEQVLEPIFKAQIVEPQPTRRRMPQQITTVHQSSAGMGFSGAGRPAEQAAARGKRQPVVVGERIGRNDPCPCGSGKKYKKCHGAAV